MLMASYATAVTIALIGITLMCVKAYERLLPKIRCYQKHVLKVNAISLLVIAVAFIFGININYQI